MFKVGLVERSGSKQYDSRIVALGEAGKRFALRAEKWGEAQYVRGAEEIWKNIGDDGAVLQRIAAARRRLRAIGEHPPLAVGRTGKIDGQHVQIAVGGNTHAHQRAEKCGVGVEKCGRKVAVRHQDLRPVEILKEQIEQLGPLNDARFDEAPLVRRNQ